MPEKTKLMMSAIGAAVLIVVIGGLFVRDVRALRRGDPLKIGWPLGRTYYPGYPGYKGEAWRRMRPYGASFGIVVLVAALVLYAVIQAPHH